MSVSKKDFIAVADILRAHKADSETVEDFCRYFRTQNPRFDSHKFTEYVKRA